MAYKLFVVHDHEASTHHYDFRLEYEGVLKSWAVPKGISMEKGVKRLAIETEDHPMEYAKFEGIIPEGLYGAGTVKIWDRGTYILEDWSEDKIEFQLSGEKLKGRYVLIKYRKIGGKNWLLFKKE